MTEAEIVRWVEHHDARFGGFAEYFGESVQPDPKAMGFWRKRLAVLELGDMERASDRLFDADGPKLRFEDHLRSVLRIVGAPSSGARQFNPCEMCMSTGYVEVVHRSWNPETSPKTPRRVAVRCRCPIGVAAGETKNPAVQFDPEIMVTWHEWYRKYLDHRYLHIQRDELKPGDDIVFEVDDDVLIRKGPKPPGPLPSGPYSLREALRLPSPAPVPE